MVIVPQAYVIKRLRTILAYKYIDAQYTIGTPANLVTLYLPIDVKYCQILNFKLTSNLLVNQKFNYLSVSTNGNILDKITNDTVLWYDSVEGGQIFDTKLQAFSVNTRYTRPDEYAQYFHTCNYEGLYVQATSNTLISSVSIYAVYEDLDNVS